MDTNNSYIPSDEESDLYDLPEYVIAPIDPEDIKAIKEIPSVEELKKFATEGFKKIYEGCKNPYLVQKFGYNLDDVPEKLLEQFRQEDEENSVLGLKIDQELQEEESNSRQNINFEHREIIDLENKNKVGKLIELNDDSIDKNKKLNSNKSSFQDFYELDKKLKENKKNFSTFISEQIDQVKYDDILRSRNEAMNCMPNLNTSQKLNGNNRNNIRFNQQIPRHEFYNQQRNLLNHNRMEMRSNEFKNAFNSNKINNNFDLPVDLVGSFFC